MGDKDKLDHLCIDLMAGLAEELEAVHEDEESQEPVVMLDLASMSLGVGQGQ